MSSPNFNEIRAQSEASLKELREYCDTNGIKNVQDKEFYFSINGKHYRVSRFKTQLTTRDTKSLPWIDATKIETISIRIRDRHHLIDIYEALKEGKDLRSLKLKKRTVNSAQVKEAQPTATPVAKPEEKPVFQNRTVSKKQFALNSLLGGKRK